MRGPGSQKGDVLTRGHDEGPMVLYSTVVSRHFGLHAPGPAEERSPLLLRSELLTLVCMMGRGCCPAMGAGGIFFF